MFYNTGDIDLDRPPLSYPMLDPITGLCCQTPLDSDQIHQTLGLLFKFFSPFTHYLIIPLHIIIRPTLDHLLHSSLSHYFLTYLSLPTCISFVILAFDLCPDSLATKPPF